MGTLKWNTLGGNWGDSSSWTVLLGNDIVPTSVDDVTIDSSLNYAVTVAGSQSAHDLTVNASGAHVEITGALAVRNLSVQSGSVDLFGTLSMTGTLTLAQPPGVSFTMSSGAILQGATVSTSSGGFGALAGTYDDITVLGTLGLGSAAVSVVHGLTLLGANGTGPGTLSAGTSGTITFQDTETFDNAVILVDNIAFIVASGTTLTLGPNISTLPVSDHGISFGGQGALVNYGTLNMGPSQFGGNLVIGNPEFDNEGVISFPSFNQQIVAAGNFVNGGTYSAYGLTAAGTVSGSGQFNVHSVIAGNIAAGVHIKGTGLGIITSSISPQATIDGLINNSNIDITGLPYSFNLNAFWSGTPADGTLTIKDGANAVASLHLLNVQPGTTFTLAPDGNAIPGTNITAIACFAAGTRIATADGEMPVEALRVGDRVRSAFGGEVPIAWIGRRTLRAAALRNPSAIYPVRIAASAITPGVPTRDLLVSPDHALYLDGVLVPAGLLVNGGSIVRVAVEEVTYFHIELPQHDVILAEGALCESYLDTGNRGDFDNAPPAVRAEEDANVIWLSRACAPQCRNGARLEAIRTTLAVVSSMLRVRGGVAEGVGRVV
ncbi:MAG: Hint domain-containing protein [Alphaproteobacteria bacterium]|nr:Hint domain-containing protein [Alphaproteobacteria bacterium]